MRHKQTQILLLFLFVSIAASGSAPSGNEPVSRRTSCEVSAALEATELMFAPNAPPDFRQLSPGASKPLIAIWLSHPDPTTTGSPALRLASLTWRLRSTERRVEGVAAVLNAHAEKVPCRIGDSIQTSWTKATIERVELAGMEVLKTVWATVDLTQREELDTLFKHLLYLGIRPKEMAVIFNFLHVNGAEWTTEAIEKKFLKPSKSESLFKELRLAILGVGTAQREQTLAAFALRLGKELGKAENIAVAFQREGLPNPFMIAGGQKKPWEADDIERLVYLAEHGALPPPEWVSMSAKARHEIEVRAKIDPIARQILGRVPTPGQPCELKKDTLIRLILALRAMPMGNAFIAKALRDYKVVRPAEIPNWDDAAIDTLIGEDFLAQTETMAGKDVTDYQVQKSFYEQLRARGYGRTDTAKIFNEVPIGGGGWTNDTLASRFEQGAGFAALPPMPATRMVLGDTTLEKAVREIARRSQKGGSRAAIAADLHRTRYPIPELLPDLDTEPSQTQPSTEWTEALMAKVLAHAEKEVFASHAHNHLHLRSTQNSIMDDLRELGFPWERIAHALTKLGAPTPSGKDWTSTSVRNRVMTYREGRAYPALFPEVFQWRSAPADWKVKNEVSLIKNRQNQTPEDVADLVQTLRWRGLRWWQIDQVFSEHEIKHPVRDQLPSNSQMRHWMYRRKRIYLGRALNADFLNDKAIVKLIQALDGACFPPERIVMVLLERGARYENDDRWTPGKVAKILTTHPHPGPIDLSSFYDHLDFRTGDWNRKALMDLALEIDAIEKEASVRKQKGRPFSDWVDPLGTEQSRRFLLAFNFFKSKGNKAKAQAVRTILVQSHLRFIGAILKEFTALTKYQSLEDWMSVGMIALTSALDDMDIQRSSSLTTPAGTYIRNEIRSELKYFHVKKRQAVVVNDSATEGAAYEGSPSAIQGTADSKAADANTVAEAEEQRFASQKLKEAMASLTDEERQVVSLRFRDDPFTLKQAGEALGCTYENVRKIEARALGRLRILMGSDFYSD